MASLKTLYEGRKKTLADKSFLLNESIYWCKVLKGLQSKTSSRTVPASDSNQLRPQGQFQSPEPLQI